MNAYWRASRPYPVPTRVSTGEWVALIGFGLLFCLAIAGAIAGSGDTARSMAIVRDGVVLLKSR